MGKTVLFLVIWCVYFIKVTLYLINYKKKKSRCTKKVNALVKDIYIKNGVGANYYKPIFEVEENGQTVIISSALPNNLVYYRKGTTVSLYVNPENYEEYLGRDNGGAVKLVISFIMGIGLLIFTLGLAYAS